MSEEKVSKVFILLGADDRGVADEVVLVHEDRFNGDKSRPYADFVPDPDEKTMTAVQYGTTLAWDYLKENNRVSKEVHHILSFRVDHQSSPIEGPSLGLAIYLKTVCEFMNHKAVIAATGELDKRGNIKKVGSIKGKINAALEKLPENGYLVVPRDNYVEEKSYFDNKEVEYPKINFLYVNNTKNLLEEIIQATRRKKMIFVQKPPENDTKGFYDLLTNLNIISTSIYCWFNVRPGGSGKDIDCILWSDDLGVFNIEMKRWTLAEIIDIKEDYRWGINTDSGLNSDHWLVHTASNEKPAKYLQPWKQASKSFHSLNKLWMKEQEDDKNIPDLPFVTNTVSLFNINRNDWVEKFIKSNIPENKKTDLIHMSEAFIFKDDFSSLETFFDRLNIINKTPFQGDLRYGEFDYDQKQLETLNRLLGGKPLPENVLKASEGKSRKRDEGTQNPPRNAEKPKTSPEKPATPPEQVKKSVKPVSEKGYTPETSPEKPTPQPEVNVKADGEQPVAPVTGADENAYDNPQTPELDKPIEGKFSWKTFFKSNWKVILTIGGIGAAIIIIYFGFASKDYEPVPQQQQFQKQNQR